MPVAASSRSRLQPRGSFNYGETLYSLAGGEVILSVVRCGRPAQASTLFDNSAADQRGLPPYNGGHMLDGAGESRSKTT